jgi:hypothetical protein
MWLMKKLMEKAEEKLIPRHSKRGRWVRTTYNKTDKKK